MLKRFTALLLSLLLTLGGTGYALDDSDSGEGESIPYSPKSISLTSSLSLPENGSASLTAVTGEHYGMPEDDITWTTSNASVCTVAAGATSYDRTDHESSSKATVKAAGAGKCTITATFGTAKASCTVYVLKTPEVSLGTVSTSAVQVKWKQVTYAQGYRIYRRTNGDGWERIGTVSSGDTLSYTDKSISPLNEYRYTVRAYRTSGGSTVLSAYNSKGVTVAAQLPAPKLVSAADTGSRSIRISWEASKNAAGYRVYRRTEGGKWESLTTLSGQKTTSYTDKKAAVGTKYIYTVRSYCKIDGKTVLSRYDSKGVSCQLLPGRPKLVSAEDTGSGSVRVSWKASDYAEGYRIYRKTADSSWTRIATRSGQDTESYTDTTAIFGTKYIYTVRAYCKANSKTILSTYDSKGVSCQLLPAQPKLVGAEDTGSGSIRVRWEASNYAEGYRIYRKTEGGKWARIAELYASNAVSYEDSTAAAGTTYFYTVRAFCTANRNTVLSTYDSAGVSASYTQP